MSADFRSRAAGAGAGPGLGARGSGAKLLLIATTSSQHVPDCCWEFIGLGQRCALHGSA